jgi:hypothetical protein
MKVHNRTNFANWPHRNLKECKNILEFTPKPGSEKYLRYILSSVSGSISQNEYV